MNCLWLHLFVSPVRSLSKTNKIEMWKLILAGSGWRMDFRGHYKTIRVFVSFSISPTVWLVRPDRDALYDT